MIKVITAAVMLILLAAACGLVAPVTERAVKAVNLYCDTFTEEERVMARTRINEELAEQERSVRIDCGD